MVSTRVLLGTLAGLSKDEVLVVMQSAGMDPELLGDPDGHVPVDTWRRLWLAIEEHRKDPLAGIHAAQALQWGHYGVIDYVVGTCADLRAGFAAFARYFRLLNTATTMELREVEGGMCIVRRLAANEEVGMPRHAAEFSLATTVARHRIACTELWTPTRVTFRAPAPADSRDFVATFGLLPEFGAREDAFWVCDADLARPMKAPDASLHDLICAHGESLLGRLPGHSSFVSRVAGMIRQDLLTGTQSVDRVAKALGVGRRTLQRKLREEGMSYRGIADQVRRELALQYLRSPHTTIAEVAYMLGFSEPSAFHRAFRQWTGENPGDFRKKPGR